MREQKTNAARLEKVMSRAQHGNMATKNGMVKAIVANFTCVIVYGWSYNKLLANERTRCLAAIMGQTRDSSEYYATVKFVRVHQAITCTKQPHAVSEITSDE